MTKQRTTNQPNRNYTPEGVLRDLKHLKIKLETEGKLKFFVIPKRAMVGKTTWGKIDFLGYPWAREEKKK